MSASFEGLQSGEADILRIAAARGMATSQEIDLARMKQERLARKDEYKDLLDVLVDQQVMTRNQIERLRQEVSQPQGQSEIPGYKLLAKLGEGSMGVVWKAKQQCLDRTVAVKILQARLARNREMLRRFHAEAHLVACLSSSH